MGHPAPSDPPILRRPTQARTRSVVQPLSVAPQPGLFRLDSTLVLTELYRPVERRGFTFTASLMLHSLIVASLILVPLFFDDVLPVPDQAIRGFFVAPPDAAPPPPPPPPPAASIRTQPRTTPPPQPEPDSNRLVAPIEIPNQVVPEEVSDLGIEGGVPGGVEGGVPGGVVGGVVGGLPNVAPTPPPNIVRVGGVIRAPKLLEAQKPVYPALAAQARVAALVIVEAQVDTSGRVKAVKVLRGHPLFDQAALEAVQHWRYKPLLLNGTPTEFLVTVTISFNIKSGENGTTPPPQQ